MKRKKSKLISSEVKFCAIALLLLIVSCQHKQDLSIDDQFYRRSIFVMGTKAEVFLSSNDQSLVSTLFSEFQKVEDYYSNYRQDSVLMRLRKNSELSLPKDYNLLVKVSEEVCERTGGVFNVKVAPLTEQLYRFNRNKSVLTRDQIKLIRFKGHKDTSSIASCKINIRKDAKLLDFGGIGKGFALDQARKQLYKGTRAILKMSGDIYCSEQCNFSIQAPPTVKLSGKILTQLKQLRTCKPSSTISTSGNYNIFLGSTKNNHLLDIEKGHSQQNTSSITVLGLGASAKIDAITTALSIFSDEDRIEFPLDEFAWIHIDPAGKVQKSKNFSEFFCSL